MNPPLTNFLEEIEELYLPTKNISPSQTKLCSLLSETKLSSPTLHSSTYKTKPDPSDKQPNTQHPSLKRKRECEEGNKTKFDGTFQDQPNAKITILQNNPFQKSKSSPKNKGHICNQESPEKRITKENEFEDSIIEEIFKLDLLQDNRSNFLIPQTNENFSILEKLPKINEEEMKQKMKEEITKQNQRIKKRLIGSVKRLRPSQLSVEEIEKFFESDEGKKVTTIHDPLVSPFVDILLRSFQIHNKVQKFGYRNRGWIGATQFSKQQWCEQQLDFTKRLGSQKTDSMKNGILRHSLLEKNNRPIQQKIERENICDDWGMWMIRCLSSMFHLYCFSVVREFPVFGYIQPSKLMNWKKSSDTPLSSTIHQETKIPEGLFILGIIDEVSLIKCSFCSEKERNKKRDKDENEKDLNNHLRHKEEEEEEEEERERERERESNCDCFYQIMDTKTRQVPKLPDSSQTKPTKLQLNIYSFLFNQLLYHPYSQKKRSLKGHRKSNEYSLHQKYNSYILKLFPETEKSEDTFQPSSLSLSQNSDIVEEIFISPKNFFFMDNHERDKNTFDTETLPTHNNNLDIEDLLKPKETTIHIQDKESEFTQTFSFPVLEYINEFITDLSLFESGSSDQADKDNEGKEKKKEREKLKRMKNNYLKRLEKENKLEKESENRELEQPSTKNQPNTKELLDKYPIQNLQSLYPIFEKEILQFGAYTKTKPIFISPTMVARYENQSDSSLIGEKVINTNYQKLGENIYEAYDYWTHKREPKVVGWEERRKCSQCEYFPLCQRSPFRKKKDGK